MNINKFSTQILFACLSGVLLALSFPPIPMPFLAFVALVPLLFVLNNSLLTKKKQYFLVYLTFFIYHIGSLWWISSWTRDTDIFLLFAGLALDFLHPIFFFVPFAIYFWFQRKFSNRVALILFPFVFLSFEWLHSLGDIGFPWLTLGNTQILNLYWIQFIDITGIWGASLAILLVNTLIVDFFDNFIHSSHKSLLEYLINTRIAVLSVIIIVVLMVLPYFYSFYAVQKYSYRNNLLKNKNINVAVIQPNINPWKKWETSVYEQLQILLKISDSILATNPNINLLVFPETALPMLYTDFNTLQDVSILQNWCNQRNVAILTGITEFYFIPKNTHPPPTAKQLKFDTQQYYQTFNSSILITPNPKYKPGDKVQNYRKSKLTPFGEQIPFQEELPILSKFALWSVGISSWNKGSGPNVLKYRLNQKEVRIGNIICIESIYPRFVTGFVNVKSNLFTLITNDGWYDFTVGPRQHYLMACIRAIENRRYIARSANTGISGFISPLGISLKEAPQYTKTSVELLLPLIDDTTFYSKYGDWLPILSLLSLIIIAVLYKFRQNFIQ